jgi:ubiquinone/menaquinone biosynthesis C-methylase UbiE
MQQTQGANDSTMTDRWKATSKGYSEQMAQFKLSSLYASDLITFLQDHITSSSNDNVLTILDIGCGTGAFVHAYMEHFSHGIPGHTIILSDVSPSMIQQAQASIEKKLASQNNLESFATKLEYQLEDGTTLSGIADNSIDIVVSVYGVFLIPDQVGALQSIRRVLKPNTGIFANVAWTKHEGIDPSFGGNLQEIFFNLASKVKEMQVNQGTSSSSGCSGPTTGTSTIPSFMEWIVPSNIESKLSAQYFVNVQTYRMFHSIVSNNLHTMFDLCITNPMIHATDLSETQVMELKHTFFEACMPNRMNNADERKCIINDTGRNVPFSLWTASNLTISYV